MARCSLAAVARARRARRARRAAHPDGVRPVAGPEPPQRAPPDRGRHERSTPPRRSSRSAEAAAREAPRDRAHARRRCTGSSGQITLTLVPPERAQADARSEFSAVAAQGAAGRSPGSAPRCRTRRSRASARSAARPSTSPCAAPTGTRSSQRAMKLKDELEASGLVDRPRHRLPARRARAADHARPPRARPTSASRVSELGTHGQRARRRQHRRQVLDRRAAASTSACACSPRSARAPRTSRCIQVRTQSGAARPAVAGRRRSRSSRCSRRSAASTASARSAINGNVAPGHSQAEAMAKVDELGEGAAARLPRRRRRAGLAARGDDERPLRSRSLLGILVAYMVLASQFNSFLHPVTVLTILPLAVSRRGARPRRRRQDAEPLQHDRPPAPDGDREEELDPPRRVRRTRCASTSGARRARGDEARPARCACGRS